VRWVRPTVSINSTDKLAFGWYHDTAVGPAPYRWSQWLARSRAMAGILSEPINRQPNPA
jgi:hypothetical protein